MHSSRRLRPLPNNITVILQHLSASNLHHFRSPFVQHPMILRTFLLLRSRVLQPRLKTFALQRQRPVP